MDRADAAASLLGGPGPRTAGGPPRPAGLCWGAAHVVVHANPALLSAFSSGIVGIPAREALVGLPREAFDLLDAVLRDGRPLAREVLRDREPWRMTVVPRRDPETGEVYGVTFYLRSRRDPAIAR